ncbi:uncharacterized protein F4812DRAFT_458858 [Daldinia caldariorum]|uniref:uncharacterized protein n=1 Tax=Daldinia caldariorum TaxID=326644 RepID=UPI002007A1D7|nr:uncharacterized protein F4812DRAFT_458858 [Daldinia caldariorum]KAI1468421.1 hypothetical protein F4812DRAFT_458858 [Daldinia caldariorum]
MPPARARVNFKTYETSTRLLAAVVASLEGKVKLDYDVIAKLVGGGTTEYAVEHRMRPIKQLAKLQVHWVLDKKKDPGELPVENGEIQKLFGESTAAGIQWQMRDVKALGRAQRQAVAENKNPWEVKIDAPTRTKASAASTPTSRGGRTPSTAASSKRKRGPKKVTMSEEDTGLDSAETDYDAKDLQSDDDDILQVTPTPKRRNVGAINGAIANNATTPVPAKNNSNVGSGGKNVSRSLFGNGTNSARAHNDDDEVQIVDLSEDTPPPAPAPAPAPVTSTRAPVVKADPDSDLASEENSPTRERHGNPYAGGSAMYDDDDDFAEGEV